MTSRHGFTLIELLVAIVLATAVVVAARALVETVGDAGARLGAATAAEDRAFGAEMLARSIIRQARELPGDSVTLGTGRGFVLRSWCPVAGGWTEPCDAAFAIDDSTASLVVRPGVSANPLVAFQARKRIELRYLASLTNGGRWTDHWAEGGLPFAIGILSDTDTLVVPVGR